MDCKTKKYELADETRTLADGTVLHRVRALRDVGTRAYKYLKAGEFGGWVESEANLDQNGDAMVCDDAMVYGNAVVCDDAIVADNAVVCDNARVFHNAYVSDNARVCGRSRVRDNAMVYGDAVVYGNTWIRDGARVHDAAVAFGAVDIRGYADIGGDAKVFMNSDYTVFRNFWSSGRWFTYTHSNKTWRAGCFRGTGEELVKKAYADSDRSGRCYEAIVKAVETIEGAVTEGSVGMGADADSGR